MQNFPFDGKSEMNFVHLKPYVLCNQKDPFRKLFATTCKTIYYFISYGKPGAFKALQCNSFVNFITHIRPIVRIIREIVDLLNCFGIFLTQSG